MHRRKVLLIVAALVAALGTAVVFLYVRTADSRANQKFAAKQVVVANTAISPGETLAAAQSSGKIQMKTVTAGSLVPGFVTDLAAISNTDVALTTIYPGEQILRSKFGSTAASATTLTIPKKEIAVSVNLDDPNRVAGFLNPGDKVTIFATSSGDAKSAATRVLLPEVTVIGVGTTTVVSTTTTTPTGAQTTEQLPRTLLTLAVNQVDAEKVILASRTSTWQLTFGLRTSASSIAKSAGTSAGQLFN
ncbi:MAG: Flp pilus assembly protein CpaB [Actinomycetota bacterium]|nr:Flp pilus assembly protein CpaB [Actinomycetota bacterium]